MPILEAHRMNCLVCNASPIPRSPYCPRCRPPVATKAESAARRIALRTAHDARLDVFRWSGAILVLDDPTDPFHLCFGEYFPGQRSPLVVSSELIRSLAAGLGPIDFHTAVREPTMPADRSTGRPSGSGTGPGGRRRHLAVAGGSLLPIAGVRGLQEAGPRTFDARAAACSTGTSAPGR